MENNITIRGFSLVSVVLAISAIAIIATVAIILSSPGEKIARVRDAVRETSIYNIQKTAYSYCIEEQMASGSDYCYQEILKIPSIEEENLKEICNSNDFSQEECQEAGFINLSMFSPKYFYAIPIDPLNNAKDIGTGYFIGYLSNTIIVEARKAEMRDFLAVGISKEGLTSQQGENQIAPITTPQVTDITQTTATVTAQTGNQVRISNQEWQDSPHTFTNLTSNTQYSAQERYKGTETRNPSPPSEETLFSTLPSDHNLTINIVGAGTETTYGAGTHSLEHNTEITLTPNPITGHTFSHYSGDCSDQTCTFNLTEDTEATLHFAINTYTVAYDANSGNCSPFSRTVNHGSTSAAPSCSRNGYTLTGFVRIIGSGGMLNASTGAVTNVTGNQTIRADWGVEWPCGSSISLNSQGIHNGNTVYCDGAGLLWTPTISGSYSWLDAISQCNNLIYAGRSDWILPNIYQLRNGFGVSACGWSYYAGVATPVAGGGGQSSCNPVWDINGMPSNYWSSSERNSSSSWFVRFNNGSITSSGNSTNYHVRCLLVN